MKLPKEICCGNCVYYRGAVCSDGQGVCSRKPPIPYCVPNPEDEEGVTYTQTQPCVSAQNVFCGDFEYYDGEKLISLFHLMHSDSDSFNKLKLQVGE